MIKSPKVTFKLFIFLNLIVTFEKLEPVNVDDEHTAAQSPTAQQQQLKE